MVYVWVIEKNGHARYLGAMAEREFNAWANLCGDDYTEVFDEETEENARRFVAQHNESQDLPRAS